MKVGEISNPLAIPNNVDSQSQYYRIRLDSIDAPRDHALLNYNGNKLSLAVGQKIPDTNYFVKSIGEENAFRDTVVISDGMGHDITLTLVKPVSSTTTLEIEKLKAEITSSSLSADNKQKAVSTLNYIGAEENHAILQKISESSTRYNIDPNLMIAIMTRESVGNPLAVSHRRDGTGCGAAGLMQIMPGTAKDRLTETSPGIPSLPSNFKFDLFKRTSHPGDDSITSCDDAYTDALELAIRGKTQEQAASIDSRFDPAKSIELSARYLWKLKNINFKNKDIRFTIASYNGGTGAVSASCTSSGVYSNACITKSESKDYVDLYVYPIYQVLSNIQSTETQETPQTSATETPQTTDARNFVKEPDPCVDFVKQDLTNFDLTAAISNSANLAALNKNMQCSSISELKKLLEQPYTKDKQSEDITNYLLGRLYENLETPITAIEYYKQSTNQDATNRRIALEWKIISGIQSDFLNLPGESGKIALMGVRRPSLLEKPIASIRIEGANEQQYREGDKLKDNAGKEITGKKVTKVNDVETTQEFYFEVQEVQTNKVILKRIYIDAEKNPLETQPVEASINLNLNLESKTDYQPNNQLLLSVTNINTQSEASVTILPGTGKAVSDSTFSVHIPVAKRTIKFTDEQIDSQINATQKMINKLSGYIDFLNKVIQVGVAICYATWTIIMVKTFFKGDPIKQKAQSLVMRGADGKSGWFKYCQENSGIDSTGKKRGEGFSNYDACVFAKEKEINIQVENYNTKIKSSQEQAKNYLSKGTNKADLEKIGISEQSVYDSFMNNELSNSCPTSLGITCGFTSDLPAEKLTKLTAIRERSEINIPGLTPAQKEELILEIYNRELPSQTVSNIGTTIKDVTGADSITGLNINNLLTEEPKQIGNNIIVYTKDTAGKIMPVSVTKSTSLLEGVTREKLDQSMYDLYQTASTPPVYYLAPKIATSIQCKDEYVNQIDYNNDKSLFRLPYDASKCLFLEFRDYSTPGSTPGKVWLVNPNTNQVQVLSENNPVTASDYNKAINLWRQAQYENCRNNRISMSGRPNLRCVLGTQNLEQEAAKSQCTDTMSISSCKTLFFVCDPVMCPSSRFNLGGRYPVSNVISTGIYGSLILGGDSLNPTSIVSNAAHLKVCLPGVQAGLEGLRSMLQGYNQCLQTQKKEGKAVGICDQIQSTYACELIWKEAYLIGNVLGTKWGLIPSFDNPLSGGGEYSNMLSQGQLVTNQFKTFTEQYKSSPIASFQSKSTEEIGTQICAKAFYGKMPSLGEISSQMLTPESPVQFSAYFDESPYSEENPTTGNLQQRSAGLSRYNIYYHVYAGSSNDLKYSVYMKHPVSGVPVIYVTDEVNSQLARTAKGSTIDKSLSVTSRPGYTQICIWANGKEECGNSRLSTSLAFTAVQDQLTANSANQLIKTADECMPSNQGPVVNDVLALPTTLGNSNAGINRLCSNENPGKSTGKIESWQIIGTCGKDELGRSLGQCWIDISTIDITDRQLAGQVQTTITSSEENQPTNQKIKFMRESFTKLQVELNKIISDKFELSSNGKTFSSQIALLPQENLQSFNTKLSEILAQTDSGSLKNALITSNQLVNSQTLTGISSGNTFTNYRKLADLTNTVDGDPEIISQSQLRISMIYFAFADLTNTIKLEADRRKCGNNVIDANTEEQCDLGSLSSTDWASKFCNPPASENQCKCTSTEYEPDSTTKGCKLKQTPVESSGEQEAEETTLSFNPSGGEHMTGDRIAGNLALCRFEYNNGAFLGISDINIILKYIKQPNGPLNKWQYKENTNENYKPTGTIPTKGDTGVQTLIRDLENKNFLSGLQRMILENGQNDDDYVNVHLENSDKGSIKVNTVTTSALEYSLNLILNQCELTKVANSAGQSGTGPRCEKVDANTINCYDLTEESSVVVDGKKITMELFREQGHVYYSIKEKEGNYYTKYACNTQGNQHISFKDITGSVIILGSKKVIINCDPKKEIEFKLKQNYLLDLVIKNAAEQTITPTSTPMCQIEYDNDDYQLTNLQFSFINSEWNSRINFHERNKEEEIYSALSSIDLNTFFPPGMLEAIFPSILLSLKNNPRSFSGGMQVLIDYANGNNEGRDDDHLIVNFNNKDYDIPHGQVNQEIIKVICNYAPDVLAKQDGKFISCQEANNIITCPNIKLSATLPITLTRYFASGSTTLDKKEETIIINPDQRDASKLYLTGSNILRDNKPIAQQLPISTGSNLIYYNINSLNIEKIAITSFIPASGTNPATATIIFK